MGLKVKREKFALWKSFWVLLCQKGGRPGSSHECIKYSSNNQLLFKFYITPWGIDEVEILYYV